MDQSNLELELDESPHAPRVARERVTGWLADIDGADPIRDDVLAVVSELVTNAVIHARSAPRLCAIRQPGRLRFEIADRSPSAPAVRSSPGIDGGFGLKVVESLAARWGWQPIAGGKVVWVEFTCP